MQPCLQMVRAERLGGIWSAFHRGAELLLTSDDAQYLRRLALAVDDDLVSYLLLMKLRQADLVPAQTLLGEAVRITSRVRFTVNAGASRSGRILHPSPCRDQVARNALTMSNCSGTFRAGA